MGRYHRVVASDPVTRSEPADEGVSGGPLIGARPGGLAAVRALLVGVGFIMAGNGLQGAVLGVRAEHEGFGLGVTGLVMGGYFLGFLFGTRAAEHFLKTVGHIRGVRSVGVSCVERGDLACGVGPSGVVDAAEVRVRRMPRRCVGDRRVVAQRHGHQRDSRPVAVDVHGRDDGRPGIGADPAQRRGSIRFPAVRGLLRADLAGAGTGVAVRDERSAVVDPRTDIAAQAHQDRPAGNHHGVLGWRRPWAA